MNSDSVGQPLAEQLKQFDVARHGGEDMAGAPVGREIIEVYAASFELLRKVQEMASESTNPAAGHLEKPGRRAAGRA